MSRQQYQSAGRTRSGFSALAVDELDSASESENEVTTAAPPTIVPPVTAEDTTTSSRANSKEPAKPVTRQASTQSKNSKAAKKAAKKSASGTSTPKEPNGTSVAKELTPEPNSDEVAPTPKEPEAIGLAEPTPTPATTLSPSDTLATPSPAPPSPASNRGKSPARPPAVNTTPFQPSLPESLPTPTSPGLGPRKRKASQDLKSNPLTKDQKIDEAAASRKSVNGVTTATTEYGEKIGVVELALAQAAPKSADHDKSKSLQQIITRTIWTLIMFGGFIGLLLAGPAYMIMLIMGIQTQVYREVTNLFGLAPKAKGEQPVVSSKKRDPWSKTLNWYFFAVTNYFLYGESMIYYFKHVVYADVRFLPFANNHRFISFMLYMFGFMGFVASLKRQYLRAQFGLFGWVHMSLLVIVISSHFIVNNILEGMIWLWVPASLVICNDIFAYIWGKLFGRTQLIALSPKKTVEGFVGAFVTTVVLGLAWGTFFMRYQYMICPVVDLGQNAFSQVQCEPNPAFIWRTFTLPQSIAVLLPPMLRIPPINWAPFQIHTLAMTVFASLVAPFGGFFASGFKRAFDLKDFGDSIPGHGGLTDRMDCQFLMGMFTYVYYSSIVRVHRVTVGSVMQSIVSGLSLEEQITLFNDLRYYLEGSLGANSSIAAGL